MNRNRRSQDIQEEEEKKEEEGFTRLMLSGFAGFLRGGGG
jgi:hypothetical protein